MTVLEPAEAVVDRQQLAIHVPFQLAALLHRLQEQGALVAQLLPDLPWQQCRRSCLARPEAAGCRSAAIFVLLAPPGRGYGGAESSAD